MPSFAVEVHVTVRALYISFLFVLHHSNNYAESAVEPAALASATLLLGCDGTTFLLAPSSIAFGFFKNSNFGAGNAAIARTFSARPAKRSFPSRIWSESSVERTGAGSTSTGRLLAVDAFDIVDSRRNKRSVLFDLLIRAALARRLLNSGMCGELEPEMDSCGGTVNDGRFRVDDGDDVADGSATCPDDSWS